MNIPPPFNGRERNIAYVEFIDEEAMNAGLDKHAEVLLIHFCLGEIMAILSDSGFP